VQHIIAREGVSGLYSGMSSALFGISVTNFVYYYWYEWTRAFFESAAAKAGRASKKLTTVESMIAGAIAGSATVILTNPIWVVNTRMTARKSTESSEETLPGGAPAAKEKKPSTIGTLLSLLRTEGPQALFAGVVPALVLVINPILQYTLFEQMKNAVERRRRVTPTVAFFLGALGKLFATSVTYPYITVKSQMHVAKAGEKKEGVFEAINRVVKEEGYAGLYKGAFCYRLPSPPLCSACVLTSMFRHRPQGHPERADRRPALRLQGRAVRALCPPQGLHGQEGRRCLNGGTATPHNTPTPGGETSRIPLIPPNRRLGVYTPVPEPELRSGLVLTGREPNPVMLTTLKRRVMERGDGLQRRAVGELHGQTPRGSAHTHTQTHVY